MVFAINSKRSDYLPRDRGIRLLGPQIINFAIIPYSSGFHSCGFTAINPTPVINNDSNELVLNCHAQEYRKCKKKEKNKKGKEKKEREQRASFVPYISLQLT